MYALIRLIPVAATFRGIYCIIKIVIDDEQAGIYKRRLLNLLVFTAVAELVSNLLFMLLQKYYHVI